jgi:hypothetical protein
VQDRVRDGVPGSGVPEVSGELAGPRPGDEPETLAWRLTGVVDRARALNSKFGLRPYRVFLVHVRWTGKRRGEGEQQLMSRREILPVPRVRDMDSVRRNVHSTGVIEEGDIVIDEISARIPEDDLMGRTCDLQDPTRRLTSIPNADFYWEVVEKRPSSPGPVIRRFSPPAAVPALGRAGMGWRVTLTKQEQDRGRGGSSTRGDF